jgi:hypothetical protein
MLRTPLFFVSHIERLLKGLLADTTAGGLATTRIINFPGQASTLEVHFDGQLAGSLFLRNSGSNSAPLIEGWILNGAGKTSVRIPSGPAEIQGAEQIAHTFSTALKPS